MTDPGLQHRYREGGFYARFGVTASEADPLDYVYLKVFHAMHAGRAGDTMSFLRAYIREFPDEALLVQQAVSASFGGQDVPDARLRRQIASMDAEMDDLRRASEVEESLSLWAVVEAYLWRLGAYVVTAAALGAWLANRACALRWRWAIPCGLVSALLVFALSWVVVSPAWAPMAAPVLAGGFPAAVWAGSRRRSFKEAARAAVAWMAAACPAVALGSSWW